MFNWEARHCVPVQIIMQKAFLNPPSEPASKRPARTPKNKIAKLPTDADVRVRAIFERGELASEREGGGAMLDAVIDDDVSHDDERRERERKRGGGRRKRR